MKKKALIQNKKKALSILAFVQLFSALKKEKKNICKLVGFRNTDKRSAEQGGAVNLKPASSKLIRCPNASSFIISFPSLETFRPHPGT